VDKFCDGSWSIEKVRFINTSAPKIKAILRVVFLGRKS
jgi:hypothetical protein